MNAVAEDAHTVDEDRQNDHPGAADDAGAVETEVAHDFTAGELGGLAAVVAVACTGTVSLALAQLGWHDGWLAAALGLGLTAGLAVAALAVEGRVRVRLDKAELALLAGIGAAVLLLFVPGWRYAYADKDPGIYVSHAFLIAREGDVDVADPIEENQLPVAEYFGRRLPGIWPGQGENTSTSQFYHYYSTLLATADDIGGVRGVFNATPLMAGLSIVLVTLAARRAAGRRRGTTVAALTAALLATSMIQVWQGRYPSTEILSQLFLAGALLAATLAIDRRSVSAAATAGGLATVGFLARPDGFLYVMLGVAVLALLVAVAPLAGLIRTRLATIPRTGHLPAMGLGALLWVLSAWLVQPRVATVIAMGVAFMVGTFVLGGMDRRVVAFALGLVLPLPYALWNAWDARVEYTGSVGLPSIGQLSALSALMLAGAAMVRWYAEPARIGGSSFGVLAGGTARAVPASGRAASSAIGGSGSGPAGTGESVPARRRSRGFGLGFGSEANQPTLVLPELREFWLRVQRPVAVAGTVLTAVVLGFFWFRADLFGYPEVHSHFTGTTQLSLQPDNLRTLALFLTPAGVALLVAGVAVLLFSRSRLSLYVLVVPGLALLPLYLWNARISMRLMWWVRRFVPGIWPVLLLLVALALAWALHHRFRSTPRPQRADLGTWVLRGAAAAVAVLLVATFLSQSWPLREHQEMGGSWEVSQEIANVAGDEQGVFLFAPYPEGDILHPLRNTPAPVWWVHGHITARIPRDMSISIIEEYRDAFPDQPVYLVIGENELPGHLPADRFEPAHELVTNIAFWEESPAGGPGTFRPDEPMSLRRGLTIWQLR